MITLFSQEPRLKIANILSRFFITILLHQDSYSTTTNPQFFFSSNTNSGSIAAIKNIFQLNVVSRHKKYLRLPSMVGRKRKGFFNDIKLRVMSKISSWQYKFFSSGGNKVLIKAVAQVVPAFAMSVFKLPLGICEDVQKAISRIWWSNRRKWVFIGQGGRAWAKQRGGLGFRDFASFNQALVAKQS